MEEPVNRTIKHLAVGVGALLVAASLTGCRYSGYIDGDARTAATKGATYLKSQQLTDGSFEVAGLPRLRDARRGPRDRGQRADPAGMER